MIMIMMILIWKITAYVSVVDVSSLDNIYVTINVLTYKYCIIWRRRFSPVPGI